MSCLDKTFDEIVFKFKDDLIDLINSSKIPISVLVMIFDETLQVLSTNQRILMEQLKKSEVKKDGV